MIKGLRGIFDSTIVKVRGLCAPIFDSRPLIRQAMGISFLFAGQFFTAVLAGPV